MANEELIKTANSLGIKNAETLTKPQLEKAIQNIEVAQANRKVLVDKAVSLGFDIELISEFSDEDLEKTIVEAETEKANEKLALEKEELISEFLGIDCSESTLEEIKNAITKKNSESLDLKKESKQNSVPNGKTEKLFKTEKGFEYSFSEKAPEKFRFLGIVKTQKEWIEDKDAMELMIQGNVSYVKPFNK